MIYSHMYRIYSVCQDLAASCIRGALIFRIIPFQNEPRSPGELHHRILIVRPIPLPASQHTSAQVPCNLRHIHFFKLAQAVGTIAAVNRSILPKIPENIIPQTFISKAVEGHLPHPVRRKCSDCLLRYRYHLIV